MSGDEQEVIVGKDKLDAPVEVVKDEGIRVDNVRVEVSFRIGGKRLSISELRSIKKGEVLVLDAHVNDPVVMLVNGQAKAIGEVGQEEGKFVFNVQEILD